MYKKLLKRTFDCLIALFCIIVIIPVCIIVLPAISISNGGPVFFAQFRPGMRGKLFKLWKLKTMNDKCDKFRKLLPDSDRLTKVGRFIRSVSLDELPQLVNIIRGEMSFIGPRPLLPDYLPLYNEHQGRRHDIRPGITGWAQVNGRNSLSWEEKFEHDVWYVDNISVWLDIKIIFMTIFKVVKRKGINSADSATMKPFRGTADNEKFIKHE